jgi:hypothetical protein
LKSTRPLSECISVTSMGVPGGLCTSSVIQASKSSPPASITGRRRNGQESSGPRAEAKMDFPQTKPVTEQQGSIRWDRERNLTVREIDRLVQFLHGCRAGQQGDGSEGTYLPYNSVSLNSTSIQSLPGGVHFKSSYPADIP